MLGALLVYSGVFRHSARTYQECLNDMRCVIAAAATHPAFRIENWPTERNTALSRRVAIAPPMLVELMQLKNRLDGFAQTPTQARPDEAFMADVRAALDELPPIVQKLASPGLIGIYLVDGLGSSGFTSLAMDANGKPAGAFTVLDAGMLADARANQWATWRDGTPFRSDAGWRLSTRIEDEGHDSRKNAIQYILLHELAHVIAGGTRIHPSWVVAPQDAYDGGSYPFFDLAWRMNGAKRGYTARPSDEFPLRTRVSYYVGRQLEASSMLAAYQQLARTGFPSMYGAARPGDDFAESFASYVHVRLMGRPWEVTIRHGDKPVFRLAACWGQQRCATREALLAAWLSGTPLPR